MTAMKSNRLLLLILPVAAGCLLLVAALVPASDAPVSDRPFGAFSFQDSVLVPVGPDQAFDAFVEVEAWWDHRFSESPAQFYIDPRPGGGFFEIFDDHGNGVLHAAVIVAERGKILRMNGPLGMSGYALDMVYTLEFAAQGEDTQVRLDVRGAGELEGSWAHTIQGVWHHFLAERFKPYVEGRLAQPPTPVRSP
jgi:hypothetical protein